VLSSDIIYHRNSVISETKFLDGQTPSPKYSFILQSSCTETRNAQEYVTAFVGNTAAAIPT